MQISIQAKNWTGNGGLALSAEMASSLYLEITPGGAFASGLGWSLA